MTVSANEDYLRAMIDQVEGLSDTEYSAILDKKGQVIIGGYYLWPSDILKGLPDIGENGQTLATKGSKFDLSKQKYIDEMIGECKALINSEYEEVIF